MFQTIRDIEVALAFINKHESPPEYPGGARLLPKSSRGRRPRDLFCFFALSFLLLSCASSPERSKKLPAEMVESIAARVGPHTRLSIYVYDEPELTDEVVVARDGFIHYSFVGKIKVSGLTPKQVAWKITNILKKDYVKYPQVVVTVKEWGRVYVFGQVRNPGSIPLKEGFTAMDAIVEAGGFDALTTRESVDVIREGEGTKKIISLLLKEVSTGQLEVTPRLYLMPNDTVVVK